MNDKIGVTDIRKWIRKCIRYGKPYNFLGLIENKDLTDEAIRLFEHPKCPSYYDWVNGNDHMLKIIVEEEIKKNMTPYEQLCRRHGFVPEKQKTPKYSCPTCGAERESNLINCSVCGWEE